MMKPDEKLEDKPNRPCTERRMAPPAGSATMTGFVSPIKLPFGARAVSVALLAI